MLKLFHLPNMRYIGLNMELSDLLMRRQQKIPKYRRDKHITNMDKISYEIYCNQYESARNYPITEEKQEMLIQLKELLSTFSEENVICLIISIISNLLMQKLLKNGY